MIDGQERQLELLKPPADEPAPALHVVETAGETREEVLARKLRLQTRCVVALTDDEFEKLYPRIQLGQE